MRTKIGKTADEYKAAEVKAEREIVKAEAEARGEGVRSKTNPNVIRKKKKK